MIFTPEVVTIFLLNTLFFFFGSLAFVLSIKIVKSWNFDSTSKKQYALQKSAYLTATIIKYIFFVKVPLFLFFIFTLDKTSNIISGAMCGAGVVDATEYGLYLLVLKVLNIYLFAYWILLHTLDTQSEEEQFIRYKFTLFSVFYFLLVGEIILEFFMFSSIDVSSVVDCCGVIYSSSSSSYFSVILGADLSLLLTLFYALFILMFLAFFFKKRELFSLLNLLFMVMALITLITFYSTYIYELPTHKCPFCFLQKDYNYIGYILYIVLFIGTFSGLVMAFVKTSERVLLELYRVSIAFNLTYILLVSWYPFYYYINNGVWM